MILKNSLGNKYFHQLTVARDSIKELEFALQHFRHNKERDCIVRRRKKDGMFAVFTDGIYYGYKPYQKKYFKKIATRDWPIKGHSA